MSTKVKISVEGDASHGIRVTRVATTTGQEYESRDIEAGEDVEITLDDEQRVDITRGAATPQDEAEPADAADDKAKK